MNQPPDPTRTFDVTPRQDSHADGPVSAPPEKAVSDRLELLEEIARGGMGAVLKGRDADLGRDVAVKVLLEDQQDKAGRAQRFLEEARIAGRLQHPGVVPVYTLGRLPDGRPYFTMKLVKGRTLAELLAERKQPTQDRPRFLAIFEQVCQTLAYAHSKGVIHRDLKSSNVMVGAFGEVLVMDWGLAKVLPRDGAANVGPAPTAPAVSVIRTPRGEDSEAGRDGSETQAGSVLGTPAYMAPEQACGEVEDVDRRADVFGLGAVLCEVLTGQPPFPGPSETALKKARRADLTDAFARLDGCGADADLIALAKRCLAAKPEERPRDAGETAAAVTEYQRSVAERLRRAELERAAAEAKAGSERKRRRATLALAAAVLALVLVGGGVAVRWQLERTAVTRDVEAALAEAASHQEAGRWPEARAALERAEGRLGGSGLESLRQRLRQAEADADMVAELEAIRLRLSEAHYVGGERRFDATESDAQYAGAFRRYGIDIGALAAADAAARVRRSAIREALLAALSQWSRQDKAERAGLLGVIEGADDDPWRQSFREAVLRRDAGRLKALAAGDEAPEQPPTVLEWLAGELDHAGLPEERAALLRQAQRRHPEDFWINLDLGLACMDLHPPKAAEAVGYERAAVAIRPGSAAAHNNLGLGLWGTGDKAAAIAEYRRAVELDPTAAVPHDNLGFVLKDRGDLGGAVAEFRQAVELEPKGGFAHYSLGMALKDRGDLDGAVAEFRQSLAVQPDGTGARGELVKALAPRGRLEEARAAWGAALEHEPPHHDAWYGYAELCLFLGRDDDYRRNRRALLDRFGDTTDLTVAERTGRACLLLPASGDDLERAAALADRAAAAGPKHEYYRFFLAAKGLADYRRGRFGDAIEACQQAGAGGAWMPVASPVLAMALYRSGRTQDARVTLAAAVQNYDWDETKADDQDKWIAHVLRREAEELIVPNLAAFLKGEYHPGDNAERLELIGYCRFRKRYFAASQLYADAFAADPKLADDLKSGARYNAACCAARAGRGEGVDAKDVDDKERAGWRKQALEWLRADLALWAKRLESDKPEDRKQVAPTFRRWQTDADLSGLRDPAELAKLPADEQEACRKLWADVQALLDKADAKK